MPAQAPDGPMAGGEMKTFHKVIIGDSRAMEQVADESVHLVVTSPPYWQLKDYGDGQHPSRLVAR